MSPLGLTLLSLREWAPNRHLTSQRPHRHTAAQRGRARRRLSSDVLDRRPFRGRRARAAMPSARRAPAGHGVAARRCIGALLPALLTGSGAGRGVAEHYGGAFDVAAFSNTTYEVFNVCVCAMKKRLLKILASIVSACLCAHRSAKGGSPSRMEKVVKGGVKRGPPLGDPSLFDTIFSSGTYRGSGTPVGGPSRAIGRSMFGFPKSSCSTQPLVASKRDQKA